MTGRPSPKKETSSLTLPPIVEEHLNSVALGDVDSVLALRETLLKTFYPVIEDRCPMCGGGGIYRSKKGKRVIEEGCDACNGTGRANRNAIIFGSALEVICGRRLAPNDQIAELSPSELAARVLDGKIKC